MTKSWLLIVILRSDIGDGYKQKGLTLSQLSSQRNSQTFACCALSCKEFDAKIDCTLISVSKEAGII